MIPDEAIEAAARVVALSTGHIMESDWEWEHLPKEHYYTTAHAALEAALPYLSEAARQPQRDSPTDWPDVPRVP